MNNNAVDNITDEIADDIELVLSEIKTCTENIQSLFQQLQNLFVEIYAGPLVWKIFIVLKVVKQGDEHKYYVSNWVDWLKQKGVSKACVFSAAVNWKSSVQMKLMGI